MSSASVAPQPAIERLRELLVDGRPSSMRMQDGYVDLLDNEDRIATHLSQRTMRSGLVPIVYQRVSRPMVMRFLMGSNGPGRLEEHRVALRMLALSDGDCVLDLACGPGNFTRSIAEATGDGLVVGLDAARPMLAAAVRRTHSANTAYVLGDACAPPFRDASFDAVCCFGALHLFEQPMRALDEITRVLKPDGRLALWTTYDPDLMMVRDSPVRRYGGVSMFTHDEIVGGLAERGLVDLDQRVAGKVQFVFARRPA